MNDKIYFNQDGIYVSENKVVIDGKSCPINNVDSLSYKVVPPKRWLAMLLVLIGAPLIFDGEVLITIGSTLILLGLITAMTSKTLYSVTLNTFEGEKKKVVSESSLHIERVIVALNQAMMAESETLQNQ